MKIVTDDQGNKSYRWEPKDTIARTEFEKVVQAGSSEAMDMLLNSLLQAIGRARQQHGESFRKVADLIRETDPEFDEGPLAYDWVTSSFHRIDQLK